MTSRLALNSTNVTDWRFLAEGGANLVLSYAGPVPELQGKLLRLRKKKNDPSASHAIPDEVDVRFGTEIIRPLLGTEQVVEMELLDASQAWLKEMKSYLGRTGARSAARVSVDDVDEGAAVAVLAEDLVQGRNVVAFEIKPKWGFLPSSEYLSEATKSVKKRHCRFCMHKYYKQLQKGDGESSIAASQPYCPLDLYSQDEGRIKQALQDLWSDWEATDGHTNSFRVFVDGHKVEPTNQEILHSRLNAQHSRYSTLELVQNALVPHLLGSPLLPMLSSYQARLDVFDIEGLNSIFGLDLNDSEAEPRTHEQPTLKEWRDWLTRASATFIESKGALGPDTITERDAILAYLLSATFKDCSVMIRLQFDVDEGDAQDCKIKAIDLDPKPVARLRHYFNLDRDIVHAWCDILASRRNGKDPVKICRV